MKKRQRLQQQALNLEEVTILLRRMYDQCPWCMIYNAKSANHTLYRCTQSESLDVRRQYQRYRNAFRQHRPFASLSTCFFCFLPPDLCQKWVSKKNQPGWTKTSQECSYPDVTISIFVVALTLSIFRTKYRQRLQSGSIVRSEEDNIEDEIRYLGQTIDWAGLEVSRLFEVFIEAIQVVRDQIDYSIT